MNNPLLHADSVCFSYGKTCAVDGVSLALAPGEVVALLGPNGSGKSTFIKLLLGHLRAASGAISWENRDIRHWPRKRFARLTAYLPQSPLADGEQTVAEVLRLGRAPYLGAFGLESMHDVEVVGRVSVSMELDDLLDRRMDELSGGQRQRVFIGRCLAQEPRALLLDEPNTFLDLRHQIELCQWLVKLAREQGIAVLMALHDLNLAATYADRLLLMHNGQTAATGSPDEVLEPALLSRVYQTPLERINHPGRPLIVPRL